MRGDGLLPLLDPSVVRAAPGDRDLWDAGRDSRRRAVGDRGFGRGGAAADDGRGVREGDLHGGTVEPDFEEGVRYMEFTEAIAISAHTGEVVALPPEPTMETWAQLLPRIDRTVSKHATLLPQVRKPT